MLALQATPPAALCERFPRLSLAQARRIVAAVHRGAFDYRTFNGVRRDVLLELEQATHVPSLRVVETARSALDPFIKLMVAGAKPEAYETVRIPLEKPGRFVACVSSQVGCALACAFCATGRLGLLRNLEAWEIVEQVRAVKATLAAGERVHGVVFQGMGEPLANLDRVLTAIAVLTEPSALAIDGRNVTVCTSGLPSGIVRLGREVPKVRLGLSLGSARADVRAAIMPIERSHPLSSVLEAVVEHARLTKRAPMWAVTLLAGVNDSAADAHALAERARWFEGQTGHLPRLSIIPYNATLATNDPFARTSVEVERAFRDVLHAQGIPTHRRYSGGSDVAAACGQLVAERRSA